VWALVLVLVLVVWSTPSVRKNRPTSLPLSDGNALLRWAVIARSRRVDRLRSVRLRGGGSEYSLELERSSTVAAARTAKKYQLLLATALSASVIAGGVLNAVVGEDYQSFHFTNEGYFGPIAPMRAERTRPPYRWPPGS
jgi:hypothetical protein